MNTIIERTLNLEGGYVNDVDDPGGETKFGISRRSYPHVDIKNLTKEDAAAILQRDFYDLLRLDEVANETIRWKIFDMAVNMGRIRATMYVQAAVGVRVDGIMGQETLYAINAMHPERLLLKLVEASVMHYTRIVTRNTSQVKFLAGWMTRALKGVVA